MSEVTSCILLFLSCLLQSPMLPNPGCSWECEGGLKRRSVRCAGAASPPLGANADLLSLVVFVLLCKFWLVPPGCVHLQLAFGLPMYSHAGSHMSGDSLAFRFLTRPAKALFRRFTRRSIP